MRYYKILIPFLLLLSNCLNKDKVEIKEDIEVKKLPLTAGSKSLDDIFVEKMVSLPWTKRGDYYCNEKLAIDRWTGIHI